MGEKVQGQKNEGEKKAADKKDDGKATAVFEMEMNCQDCTKKIIRTVRHLDGVEDVKTYCAENKLTVTGKANPAAIKERLDQITKKKVKLVSTQPNKDGGGEKKLEEKSKKKEEKKEKKKKEDDKKPQEVHSLTCEGEKKAADKKNDGKATAVFEMEMKCQDCTKKIIRTVRHLDGVEDVKTYCAENKLTVTGKANPAAIKERLEQITKKKVKLVSTQPNKDGGGEKKLEEKSKKKEEKKEKKKKEDDKKPQEVHSLTCEGEKKAADKKNDGKATAVFEMEMKCQDCTKKIIRTVRHLDGVEDVKTYCAENKLTVTGKANPAAIKERLEQITKKKVKLVSTQPNKDGGGEKKLEEKSKKKEEKKEKKKKEDDKKPQEVHSLTCEGEKKAADKKDDGKATAVFEMEMKCQDFTKKIIRTVRHLDGVEDVKTYCAENKLTVTGKANPAAIKERLEQITKKKVKLVSTQPNKDGGGEKKLEEKSKKKEEKKEKKKKEDDKKPQASTPVLEIRLVGCTQKMKITLEFDGVEKVVVDAMKDLVTVKGTMDVKELVPYLKQKLKGNVEVVPPKKDEGGDKKAKEAGGGGDKKAKEAGRGGGDGGKKEEGGGTKVEVSKMEYHGYPYEAPMHYWQEGQLSSYAQSYPMMDVQHHQQGYGLVNHAYANQGYVDHQGYVVPVNHPLHAPQVFSDENPNACSIM